LTHPACLDISVMCISVYSLVRITKLWMDATPMSVLVTHVRHSSSAPLIPASLHSAASGPTVWPQIHSQRSTIAVCSCAEAICFSCRV